MFSTAFKASNTRKGNHTMKGKFGDWKGMVWEILLSDI
jgi:hypothetical protein